MSLAPEKLFSLVFKLFQVKCPLPTKSLFFRLTLGPFHMSPVVLNGFPAF